MTVRSSTIFASRRARAFAVLAASLASLYACGGDDTSGGTTPSSLDSGTGNDATMQPMDSSMMTSDSATDGATPTDGAAPPTGPCSGLPGTVVYIESGDTQENLLKRLGRSLRDNANITLAFNLTGSCTLTNDIYTNANVVKNGTLKYIPSTAEDPNWDPSKPEPTCSTDATGVSIDVAISALFVESCGLGGPPAGSGLGLLRGPVQAYTFVVPTASTQTAIWAEEAYYAFGFGNANKLTPWNMEQLLFIRPPTKSTLVATALNIAVPPNKWKGVPEAASGDVVNAVKGATNAQAAIGILGDEVYDANRGKGINVLAYKAYGQDRAYYPDSTSTSFDKQNLRDGHYTLWSPTVYIAKVDANNVPTNTAVHYLIDLVLGNPAAPPPGGTAIDGLAPVVKVGLVPECAMKVTRNADGGDLSPFTPAGDCTCYYLSKITGATGTPAGCTACTMDAMCGAGKCNHGFCEPDTTVGPFTGDAGSCFSGTPTTNAEIVNACTNATAIDKAVDLTPMNVNGGLAPLP